MKRSLCLAVAVLLALGACTKVGDRQGAGGRHPWTVAGTVRIGTADEPDSLIKLLGHSAETDEVTNLLFAPVFRFDERGELYPELATAVPTYANGGIARDNRTITIHFRPNVRWSDGAPLTVRDLRFTWQAVMNPKNNAIARTGWDDIAAMDVPDERTAVIHLKRPYAPFIASVLGGGAIPPMPEHLLARYPDLNRIPFNTHPLSSGPWLLARWNHGASIEFAPNTRYWRGPPKLKHITLKIVPNTDTLFLQLKTHDIDVYDAVAENRIAQLAGIDGIAVKTVLLANERHLGINIRKPALREAAVRRAIAEAVDWNRINRLIYHGYNVRASSDILPTMWAAPRIPLYAYDPRHAAALLDAAGWKPGADGVRAKNGVRLEINISTATGKQAGEQTEVFMQQQLRDVGIALAVRNYPSSLLFASNGPLYGGTYDLSWSIDTFGPDPDNEGSWSGAKMPPNGMNTSFLDDPVVNQTARAALLTFDRGVRKALYQKEEARLHELVPAVFLYWQNARFAYNSDLKNYKPAQFIANAWNSWDWEI